MYQFNHRILQRPTLPQKYIAYAQTCVPCSGIIVNLTSVGSNFIHAVFPSELNELVSSLDVSITNLTETILHVYN